MPRHAGLKAYDTEPASTQQSPPNHVPSASEAIDTSIDPYLYIIPGLPLHVFTSPPPSVTAVGNLDFSKCRDKLRKAQRDLEWRDRDLGIKDSRQRQAAKIYTHGYEVPGILECSRCKSLAGPFQKCVVAFDDDGYLARGCCANCVWCHRADTCSLRATLPCEALAKNGDRLGVWKYACGNHCFGDHLKGLDWWKVYYPHRVSEQRRAIARKKKQERQVESNKSESKISHSSRNGIVNI